MPRVQKIYLSDTDKKLFGVCGGLAERFSLDSTLVRLAVVFTALVTAIFPVFITYVAAAFIIPHKPKDTPSLKDPWREFAEAEAKRDADQQS
ncbi:MAG TPA: PspC domain-containing protein [Candidatus Paceibacterota bacterium]|nr:PspC domain-containing protein [Candidatus Paceibacterota bacterium]